MTTVFLFSQLLCLFSAFYATEGNVVNLSLDQMRTWYPDDIASLILSKNRSSESNNIFVKSIPTIYGRDKCCPEDIPWDERGLDIAIKGFEDGRFPILSQLLTKLSHRDMAIVLFGDSTNTMLQSAFVNEVRIENYFTSREINMKSISWYENLDIYDTLGLFQRFIGNMACTEFVPPSNSSSNPVLVYRVHSWDIQEYHSLALMQKLTYFLLHDHPNGIFFLANIGHHLQHEKNFANDTFLNERISFLLNWLHEIALYNTKNVVAYRETTAFHFSSNDGSQEGSQYPQNEAASKYICEPLHTEADSRENKAVRNILASWDRKNDSRVGYVKVFCYLLPYHNMHFGKHCGNKKSSDCGHMCAFIPVM
jgi:hypothetical protein